MKAEKIKKGLWSLLFVVLCAPFVQHCTEIIQSGYLDGYYETAPDVQFSKQGWWDGTYQEGKNKYVNDHVGFRNDFIRINSQLYYSVYHMAWGALRGKGDYLYYHDYVSVALGKTALPYDTLRKVILQLKMVQDELAKEHKFFVFLHAANKAVVYQEFTPDRPGNRRAGLSNREMFIKISDSVGLSHIDPVSMLISKKPTGPVFTKQGIHWSEFGAMYVVDTLVKFMELTTGKDLANPEWGNVLKTEVGRGGDNDVGRSLNLIIPIKETFYYPEIKFPVDKGERISVVYIGDSFMWPLLNDSLVNHTHGNWEFWYYFNKVYTDKTMRKEETEIDLGGYNWRAKMDNTEGVVMLFSETNLHHLSRIADSLYNYCADRSKLISSQATEGK